MRCFPSKWVRSQKGGGGQQANHAEEEGGHSPIEPPNEGRVLQGGHEEGMEVESGDQNTPPLTMTPEIPWLVLGEQPVDQVIGGATGGGKRRQDSKPGPSFVTGPSPEPTTKRRGVGYVKRGRSPGAGPHEAPIGQAPKRGRGRPPKKPPPVRDLVLDSSDEETMCKIEETSRLHSSQVRIPLHRVALGVSDGM